MKSFADAQRHKREAQYSEAMDEVDATTKEGARAILSSRGGKKAAQLAIATLWKARNNDHYGFMLTARINAPLRVLQALEQTGIVERGTGAEDINDTTSKDQFLNDRKGHAWTYRLTDMGLEIGRNK